MTTNVFEVPLSATAQTFDIKLLDISYHLRVVWNPATSCWVLDIADASNTPIISGLPMVTGCDLLGQLAYIGLGGSLLVMTDADGEAIPTYANLGTTGHLFFATKGV